MENESVEQSGSGRVDEIVRPLADIETSELKLELHLRRGPIYQCQSPDCKSYEDGMDKWETCPRCGRKGYLCGSFFPPDKDGDLYRQWENRTVAKYRG